MRILLWSRKNGKRAEGGRIAEREARDGDVAIVASPGRWTEKRDGETWAEAMNRLTEGRDL